MSNIENAKSPFAAYDREEAAAKALEEKAQALKKKAFQRKITATKRRAIKLMDALSRYEIDTKNVAFILGAVLTAHRQGKHKEMEKTGNVAIEELFITTTEED